METFLVLCPTHRDHRELAKVAAVGVEFLFHDYASLALESLVGAEPARCEPVADPIAEIERILERFAGVRFSGVISTDDYPGSTLAAAVARKLGLPGPDPAVNLVSQHKYYSRLVQRQLVPDAVPEFALLDVGDLLSVPIIRFPSFVKPVKSLFSIGAQPVSSQKELDRISAVWAQREAFFRPFEQLLEHFTGLRIGTEFLLAETPLCGVQTTVEGYALRDRVEVLGVVDSVMFPGTLAFQRFEYPSSLPARVQHRMTEIAKRLMEALGYRNGMFNIEFMYDAAADRVQIIEVNPRMASQFADLYEKVDGTNSYSVLLDIAAGRTPQRTVRKGRHCFAASCVLRTFEDRHVVAVPSTAALDELTTIYDDIRIEVLATEGKQLSQEMQDGHSYRYAVLNLGGWDRDDVLAKLAICERRLDFAFEPVRQSGDVFRMSRFTI